MEIYLIRNIKNTCAQTPVPIMSPSIKRSPGSGNVSIANGLIFKSFVNPLKYNLDIDVYRTVYIGCLFYKWFYSYCVSNVLWCYLSIL